MRLLVIVAVLTLACGTRTGALSGGVDATTPSHTPVATVVVTAPVAKPTPTPAPTPDPADRVFAADPNAFPPELDIWATSWSNVVRHWSAGTVKEIAFPCREANAISSDPRGGAIVACGDAGAGVVATYRITDGGSAPFLSDLWNISPLAISPDGRQAVVARRGACLGPAPVCDYRYLLRDLASAKEQVLLPNGYYLGATIGWTALGLTYIQPGCAEAGCSGIGDKGGTFVWDGSVFKRQSALRFVAAAGAYRVYERGQQSNRADASVVLSGPSGDVNITPDGEHERALSVSANGEVLVAGGDHIDRGVTRYDATGKVIWHAAMDGDGIRAYGDRYVAAPFYSAMGIPVFRVYDLTRGLRFDVPLGDARVWTAAAR